MQRDAGVISRRLTAAEDTTDSAGLEWPARLSPQLWDADTAAGRSWPDSGSRSAGARRRSQLDAVTYAVGAPWMQRGAAEASVRTHVSCSMTTGTSMPAHGLCAVLGVSRASPFAPAVAESTANDRILPLACMWTGPGRLRVSRSSAPRPCRPWSCDLTCYVHVVARATRSWERKW